MVRNNTPETLQLILVDMKEGVEFEDYNGLPHLYKGLPIISDPKMVIDEILPMLAVEERNRLKRCKDAGFKNVKEYNLRHYKGNRIPLLVVIIDEIATLTQLYGDTFINPLTERARKCRAAGIHMVIATQYPKSEVIPTLISMNFPSRLVFHMTATSSMVVIEDGRASELVGKGRGLLFDKSEYIPLQLPFISDDEIRATVQEAITGKHVKSENYNVDEIFAYALEHFSGNLPIDALYQVFKKEKKITFHKMRAILGDAMDSGRTIDLAGTPYKAVRGTGGTKPNRLVRLDTMPIPEPEDRNLQSAI